ncbi:hypothetical protein HPB52_021326 [Rhipicephalus sanguineus]|uniref:Uncharacterized protein n=1 Tax=Rhipicephalus sanguineus TaxID=34632 RepID=A0A9D4SPE7_RHISA|nr:hypothetical protein HPB52_021326 [Rhipicephalus sanguineus]
MADTTSCVPLPLEPQPVLRNGIRPPEEFVSAAGDQTNHGMRVNRLFSSSQRRAMSSFDKQAEVRMHRRAYEAISVKQRSSSDAKTGKKDYKGKGKQSIKKRRFGYREQLARRVRKVQVSLRSVYRRGDGTLTPSQHVDRVAMLSPTVQACVGRRPGAGWSGTSPSTVVAQAPEPVDARGTQAEAQVFSGRTLSRERGSRPGSSG